MKTILISGFLLIIIYALYHYVRINKLNDVASGLVSDAIPYQQSPDDPENSVLIIGDSLQAGVGASSPEKSMAGLLGSDNPTWSITNLAVSGDETKDVLLKIQNLEDSDFDITIVQIGANDIFHLVNLEKTLSNLRQILKIAKEKSDRVIFVTSGSVGYAPLFPLPADIYYTYRSKKFISEFIKIANNENVEVINNYRDRDVDIFEKNPDKYYAGDKFHLSDAGYKVWHQRLVDIL